MKFRKELYDKIALIKAAYNFTDVAYVHLDADDYYYYVTIEPKFGAENVSENDFVNEMLVQSVRHEVYQQTKNIRELLLARSMATSIIVDDMQYCEDDDFEAFSENEVLKDWFKGNEEIEG